MPWWPPILRLFWPSCDGMDSGKLACMLYGLLPGLCGRVQMVEVGCWIKAAHSKQQAGTRQCEATMLAFHPETLHPEASYTCLLMAGCDCSIMVHRKLAAECRTQGPFCTPLAA